MNNEFHHTPTAPPGSMSADMPPGGGILVLGVDNVNIEKDRIENNNFYGITVVDYCLAWPSRVRRSTARRTRRRSSRRRTTIRTYRTS